MGGGSSLNALQEKQGRTGGNQMNQRAREDTVGERVGGGGWGEGGTRTVISDLLCGRDKALLFISNAFLSCSFWGKT